jgi:hypothetical protein
MSIRLGQGLIADHFRPSRRRAFAVMSPYFFGAYEDLPGETVSAQDFRFTRRRTWSGVLSSRKATCLTLRKLRSVSHRGRAVSEAAAMGLSDGM